MMIKSYLTKEEKQALELFLELNDGQKTDLEDNSIEKKKRIAPDGTILLDDEDPFDTTD